MSPESSCDNSSIPPEGMTVKQILRQVLNEGCIRSGVLGVELTGSLSPDDIVAICTAVYRAGGKTVVSMSFTLGDLYLNTKPYSEARHLVEMGIERSLGASYALRLRQFAMVAKRWPKDRRTDKYAWEYYRTHKPGEVGKADVAVEKRTISLKEVSSENVGGVVVLTLEGHGGQKYTVRRPRVYEEDEAAAE